MADPVNVKSAYATLSALQGAYPSGTTGSFLVLADSKWYSWSSGAWVPGGTYKLDALRDPLDIGFSVMSYGASGSATTTTGSITAGSNVLTVASVESFNIGQEVSVLNAAAVAAVTYIEVTKAPTSPGTVSITADGNTVSAAVTPLAQIFDLTFGGTADAEFQFGISLEWETKYITVFAGETAVQFCNRIRTDPYFTNLWTNWAISGTANTNVVRFTSTVTGPRLYGSQTFGSHGLYADFAQVQGGTGDKGTIAYRLGDLLKLPTYTHSRLGNYIAILTRNSVGTAAVPVVDMGTTGSEFTINQYITGIGELTATITGVDVANKKLYLSKTASYTVTNVAVRHDDTRAIQLAINAASAIGGGKVTMPPGTYRHTGIYYKNKVHLYGSSVANTVLVNHSVLTSSIIIQGTGGSLDETVNPNGFMNHWEIRDLTLTTNKTTPFFTQNGFDLLFCHTVTMKDVHIHKHANAIFEKCVWYAHYENILASGNINGWYYPSFNPSSSPSARYNCVMADNSGYGLYVENSPDVFAWFGGAFERNALGGIAIFGGECRSMIFEGLNMEENGGYQLEIGQVAGVAPSNISFRNCSFKNWKTEKLDCAVKLNRVAGFELHNTKFFNFDIAVKAENTGSSFVMTLPSFDGCRKAYKFVDYEVGTGEGFHMVVGDWNGVIGYASNGFRQIGSAALQTKFISLSALANLIP